MNATRYLPFAGRLLIGLPFAMSGLGKLGAYGLTTGMIGAAGLPLPPLAFAVAVAAELGGGILLITGSHTHQENYGSPRMTARSIRARADSCETISKCIKLVIRSIRAGGWPL